MLDYLFNEDIIYQLIELFFTKLSINKNFFHTLISLNNLEVYDVLNGYEINSPIDVCQYYFINIISDFTLILIFIFRFLFIIYGHY